MATWACLEKANYSSKFFVLPYAAGFMKGSNWARRESETKTWSELPKPTLSDPEFLSHLSTSEQDYSTLWPCTLLLRWREFFPINSWYSMASFLWWKILFPWRQVWLPCMLAGWKWLAGSEETTPSLDCKDCHKASASVCIKSLYWSHSTMGSAFK